MSYFPYDGQNGSRYGKCYEKDHEFEYNVLLICGCLNLVKSEVNLITNSKLTRCYSI